MSEPQEKHEGALQNLPESRLELADPGINTGHSISETLPASAAEEWSPVLVDSRQAWVQVLAALLCWCNSWGIVLSYGEFQAFYTVDLLKSHTPSEIAWIGSTQAFVLLLLGFFSGPLFDMGYFRLCIWSGTIITVFGLMMTSLGDKLWQILLAQGIVTGLGLGLLFFPVISNVSLWFSPAKRPLANGLSSTGSAIGSIIFPIMFRSLQPHVGFGWTTRAIAFVVLGSQVFALLLMHEFPMSRDRRRIRKLIDTTAFRDLPFMISLLFSFVAFVVIYNPFIYLSSFALLRRITDQNFGFYILSVANAATIPGRLIAGFMAGKYTGLLNMELICFTLGGIIAFAWIAISSQPALIVWAVAMGFCFGGVISTVVLTPTAFTSQPELIGTRLGMCSLMASIGKLIGGPVAGDILDHHGWTGLQSFVGAFMFGSCAILAIARIVKTGWKWKVKI